MPRRKQIKKKKWLAQVRIVGVFVYPYTSNYVCLFCLLGEVVGASRNRWCVCLPILRSMYVFSASSVFISPPRLSLVFVLPHRGAGGERKPSSLGISCWLVVVRASRHDRQHLFDDVDLAVRVVARS